MKKVVAIIAVLSLVVLAFVTAGLAVVGSLEEDDPGEGRAPERTSRPSEPVDPAVTAAPDEALQAYYSQSIDWAPCEDNGAHDCASLEVPVDYREPSGETIELALLRVPAEGDRVGSLVVNPGGPGAPGTEYASLARYVFRQPLLDGFDIVGFDPRGTGASAPVDCFSDAQMDDYIAMDPDPDTPDEVAEWEEVVDEFGAGCAANSGPVVGHVTTIEAARDMDVLRSALGEDKLTYFGASYGTKLGATYAELFPERAGRLLLDGAVDVSIDSRTMSLEQAAGFETALRAYVQNCLDSTDNCFLGDSLDEGLATIKEFLADVEDDPLPAGNRELRVGNAFYGLVAPLYNRDYWPLLSTALRSALNGDGSGLMQMSDLYSSRSSEGYEDNSMEAIYAINCLDDPTALPVEEVPSQYDDFEEASPTFGRVFAWGLTGCAGMQVESSEEPLDIRAEGADPILVLGTTRDPATPMKWAVALADQLEPGVLVERDGDGHTAYNAGNPCIDAIVEDYLLEGRVPEDGTKC